MTDPDDKDVPAEPAEPTLCVGVFLDNGTIEFKNMDIEDFVGLMQQLLGGD